MNGILALGHFCETHGPCIILCTQRCNNEPEQFPHSLTVPWCEACQSIDLKQALVSKEDDNVCYVTTRTPLQQDLAFLLKQATVRSLSCEEVSKEGGTIYFGDNERGHVLSHTFAVQDSLARGFHRKYSILMLTRDKIHLLNCWPMLTHNIKKLSSEIQDQAAKINDAEQIQRSQRAVRQAQSSPTTSARSLSQLTGQPAIFAHIHMWFTWLLSCETFVEKPCNVPDFPTAVYGLTKLKSLARTMPDNILHTICYCILTGIRLESTDEVVDTFRQLLPKNFKLPSTGDSCRLFMNSENQWSIQWKGTLPSKVPTLQLLVEKALKENEMPDTVLEPYFMSLIMQWYNVATALTHTPTQSPQLLQALGVQKHDLPLLSYWTAQCRLLQI